MDFTLAEPERELVNLCRDFAQKEIAARAPKAWDEARCPTDLLREMVRFAQALMSGLIEPERQAAERRAAVMGSLGARTPWMIATIGCRYVTVEAAVAPALVMIW